MNYFIIGDIHGCYYTLTQLLKKWDKEKEKLIFLGDLVNKGKHTFAVLELVKNLQTTYPEKVIVLKGNNDYLFYNDLCEEINLATKQKFEAYNMDYREVLEWINNLPHYYENGYVFASHAGVPVELNTPLHQKSKEVLFNRKNLKKLKKTQFLGHVVVQEPKLDKKTNAWYLDTGAGYGKSLTGARVSKKGEIQEIISLEINPKDISVLN